jgi:hypothetical protein
LTPKIKRFKPAFFVYAFFRHKIIKPIEIDYVYAGVILIISYFLVLIRLSPDDRIFFFARINPVRCRPQMFSQRKRLTRQR